MPISVAVPVICDKWIEKLLQDLSVQTVMPREIIIIDNSKTGVAARVADLFPHLPIRYLPQATNLGVNASWNLAIREAQSKLVAILNDDLVLPSTFLAMTTQVFVKHPLAGLVVPNTIGPQLKPGSLLPWRSGSPEEVKSCFDTPVIHPLGNREGWAFTIKRDLVGPIPTTMFTFCGDDFWFKQVRKRGYRAYKIMNNEVYHYVGISLDVKARSRLGLPSLEDDLSAWRQLRIQ